MLGLGCAISNAGALPLPLALSGDLGDLALDSTSFIVGTASSGAILGATPGSTITVLNAPPGFTINSAARTWAYDGSGSATTDTMFLIETLGAEQNTTPVDFTIAAGVPVNTALPTIIGTPTEGHTLTVVQGTYTNSPTSITEQWQNNSSNVAGATGNTHTLPLGSAGTVITVAETASNAAGTDVSAPQISASVGPVAAATPPSNTVAPTIAQGASGGLNVGSVLTLNPGTWTGDPAPTMTQQWKRNGTAITGATGTSYQLQAADNGATITVTRTGTNIAGSASVTSAGVGPVTLSTPAIDTTIAAPTLAVTNANTVYPPTLSLGPPAESEDDVHSVQIQCSTSDAFGSTVFDITHQVTDAELSALLIHLGTSLSALTSGVHHFRSRLLWTVSGTAYATAWGTVAGHGDTTALTISTASTYSQSEQTTMSLALTANKDVASWSVSGQDMARVQVVGSLAGGWQLQWAGNGSQNFTSPSSADGTNGYQVKLTATDLFGNVASLNLTITVTQVDLSPDAFSFAPVSNATVSTDYTSDTITVSGVAAGFSVPVSISGGTYSKNGGAFTGASGTAVNGDTFAVKVHSSASGATGTSAVLTIGSGPPVSSVFSVTTTGFTPNSMWLTTENGDWWDVGDRSLMFQDTAGTIPVTAVGQHIKRWVGKRGNIVLTDTTGLQLLNDGTSDYVYGGGSGALARLVSTADATVTNASGELTAFGSFMVSAVNSLRVLVGCDNGATNRLVPLQVDSTGPVRTIHFNTSGSAQSDFSASGPAANTRFTARAKHKTGSPATLEAWLNSASNGATNVTGTLSSGATPVKLFTGAGTGTGGAINEGKIYRGFGLIGRVTTGAEDTSLETWLSA